MMNLQMILLSGFYFSFLGILNEIQADKASISYYEVMKRTGEKD